MAVIKPIKTTDNENLTKRTNSPSNYEVVTPFQKDLEKRVPNAAYVVILLSIVALLTGFANTAFNPAIVEVAKEYSTDVDHIQAISAEYLFGLGCGQLFWGPVCDRFGRRKALIAAALASAVTNTIFVATYSYEQLQFARFLQGLAFSSFGVIPTAILRDIYSANKFTVCNSWVMIFFLMSPAFAPIFGGYILIALKWQFIFHVISAIIILCAVAYLVTIPETQDPIRRQPLQPKKILKNYWTILRDPQSLVGIILAAFVAMTLLSWTTLSAAIYIKDYNISLHNFGYWSCVPVLFTVIANQYNAKLVDRFNPQRIFVVATIGQFFSAFLNIIICYWFLGPVGVVIAQSINLFFTGFQNGDLMSIFLLKYTHMAATAAALFLAIRTMIVAVFIYIVAYMPRHDGGTLMIFGTVIIFLTTITTLIYNTIWPAPGAKIYRLRMKVLRRKHKKMTFRLFYII